MIRVQLNQIHLLPAFADGFALDTYQRIGRLIRTHGVTARVRILEWSTDDEKHEALAKALDELEY